jgi:hypothetical protein
VANESAFAQFHGQTSHGMPIPPGYTSVSVEKICQPDFEELDLKIPGGDGEKTRYHIMAKMLSLYNP